jgi:hypothetical protein
MVIRPVQIVPDAGCRKSTFRIGRLALAIAIRARRSTRI